MPPHPPSVDRVLRSPAGAQTVARFGHHDATAAIRAAIADVRAGRLPPDPDSLAAHALVALERGEAPSLRPVINLTGTVLHTNLGRALLAEPAIDAAVAAMRAPATLEYDLTTGARGERDDHIAGLLCELTGAEAAIAVNNNAAALVLALAPPPPGARPSSRAAN